MSSFEEKGKGGHHWTPEEILVLNELRTRYPDYSWEQISRKYNELVQPDRARTESGLKCKWYASNKEVESVHMKQKAEVHGLGITVVSDEGAQLRQGEASQEDERFGGALTTAKAQAVMAASGQSSYHGNICRQGLPWPSELV